MRGARGLELSESPLEEASFGLAVGEPERLLVGLARSGAVEAPEQFPPRVECRYAQPARPARAGLLECPRVDASSLADRHFTAPVGGRAFTS